MSKEIISLPDFEFDGLQKRGKLYINDADLYSWLLECAITMREANRIEAYETLVGISACIKKRKIR